MIDLAAELIQAAIYAGIFIYVLVIGRNLKSVEKTIRAWENALPPNRVVINTEQGKSIICRLEQTGPKRWLAVPPDGYKPAPADVVQVDVIPGGGSIVVGIHNL